MVLSLTWVIISWCNVKSRVILIWEDNICSLLSSSVIVGHFSFLLVSMLQYPGFGQLEHLSFYQGHLRSFSFSHVVNQDIMTNLSKSRIIKNVSSDIIRWAGEAHGSLPQLFILVKSKFGTTELSRRFVTQVLPCLSLSFRHIFSFRSSTTTCKAGCHYCWIFLSNFFNGWNSFGLLNTWGWLVLHSLLLGNS